MALTMGRKKRTPETTTLRGVIQMIGILGYLWLEPRLLKAYSPEQLAGMVRQRNVKGLAFRMNTGAATGANDQFVQFGMPGHADIVVLRGSLDRTHIEWIGIEVKTETGRLNSNQEKFHAMVNALTEQRFPAVVVIRNPDELKQVL